MFDISVCMKKQMAGFTLLELLMTLVVAAVLLSIGIPSLGNVLAKGRVQAHQRDLLSNLSYARSEAVSRNEDIGICGSSNGTTCANSSNWSSGWIIFVDDGAGTGTAEDGLRNGTEELLRVYDFDGNNQLTVTDANTPVNNINGFGFDSRGHLSVTSSKLTLKVCESGNDVSFARAVLVEQTGRSTSSYDLTGDSVYEDVKGGNLTCP